jgi:hypothetical protein
MVKAGNEGSSKQIHRLLLFCRLNIVVMGARSKRCVHCLSEANSTKDHVFPYSWYPDSTPGTIQRWTAPSCSECNSKFGELETDLLVRLIGSVHLQSEAASGLHAKAFRSLGIGIKDDELSEQEMALRKKRKDRLHSEFVSTVDSTDLPGRIPGLGPSDGSAQHAIPIPMAGLSMIAEKIARGCEYNFQKQKRIVERPYSVRTRILDDGIVPEPFASAGELIDFGPGCKITRVFVIEDPNVVLYWITIWNTLHLQALIIQKEEMSKASAKFDGVYLAADQKAMRIPDYLRDFERQA